MNVATRGNNSVLTKGNTDLITVNRIGNGLRFDGVDDSTFTTSPASNFNFGTGNFSIVTTIKILSINPAVGTVFVVYNGVSNYGLFILSNGNILPFFRDSANNILSISVPSALNTIYHLVIVRVGTTMLLYINNVLVGTNVNASFSNINVSNTYLLIGGTNTDAPNPRLQPANSQFQNMEIYDFKILNTNISAGQVNQLYISFGNDISGLESNIVADYNFNQKSGTILTDNSPNQLHGTLTNFAATSNLGGGAWVNSLGNTITY